MSLFNFGKKKEEEKKESACCCNCDSPTSEQANACCSETKEGICCIKVLGAGCKSCHELYENAKEAVKAMGLAVEVEYITDMQKVMEYGVMSMPAIVVNEQVVSMGKVLKTADVENLLHKLGY
ncbi:MAG: thioredoxin family protein [Erysipelotrichaceae bacterium]|nr:thioredoxin family protein [Erysipelotrichaceae bacterium]